MIADILTGKDWEPFCFVNRTLSGPVTIRFQYENFVRNSFPLKRELKEILEKTPANAKRVVNGSDLEFDDEGIIVTFFLEVNLEKLERFGQSLTRLVTEMLLTGHYQFYIASEENEQLKPIASVADFLS